MNLMNLLNKFSAIWICENNFNISRRYEEEPGYQKVFAPTLI
jgi:hypothetical protein